MKFIVKFFPEITIKSKPVRKQFVKNLSDNLKKLLLPLHESVRIQKDWDKLVVHCDSNDEQLRGQMIDTLACTPGIAYFLDVVEFPLGDMHDVFEKTQQIWGQRLAGKTFVVRCKRAGKHDFNSNDLERYVGGGLLQHTDAAGVKLRDPDVTVNLEVRDDKLYVVNDRHEGLGGFPLGSIDPVLSLISGGFDSTVSTYLTMKRGMRTHFCFFNLGGRDHEIGVKEVALYLWMKYGASSRVRFVTVPFEGVVSEILKNIDDSQMGVVLKRMMLRAGAKVAQSLNVQALVTGDSVAQVSSQTLTNLTVVDAATDMLVLRPLITMDKGDIIKLSAQIGTEPFAAAMPEYCGVISVKPTTRAKMDRIENQEQKFDFDLIDKAVAEAQFVNIDKIDLAEMATTEVEVLNVPIQDGIIIDVRHPSEEERKPLVIKNVAIEKIPFYELHSKFAELDKSKVYLLYCDKGVMSRLHASHLVEQGYGNVKVYRPL
ncbi:tRNA 4-thiouridine(8) synthase ThiI [Dasania sp. GY-MA-18]|uniref:tRNA sulfurtransferase n=1 Tax=Dasania phycosphaerae TaxID=2950436 RepID=A0A9J6RMU9_9GAMM|nr:MULTISPECIES: tRNA uracil 4-sulfurtransferase ThiI [Dasania]MCR8923063.1 tRNA 4-thiouridine(8) synthase ThiI [Dasania sp. GY-MA-18]MCZ0865495.1 tRNA 4-thiouridine(8) synthase ThiI [Dasania phycosphaerae]MCZ0869220.1 tRNA 4-thiouridine(8) synthase ThiI [Dasania phycosphaerae]